MDKTCKRLYTREHLWCLRRANNTAIIGLSDVARRYIGTITWIWLPQAGRKLSRGETFATIELDGSLDALVSPVDCTIINVNNQLRTCPDTLNGDPLREGWILHVRLGRAPLAAGLMDGAQYRAYLGELAGAALTAEPG